MMASKTAALRRLLAEEAFIHMPVAYDALGGRLIENTGFKAVYVGGFVTGGSRCTSEPLLTLDEQVRVAGDVAKAITIPTLADAGAGFGEPLHTMRTVREFIHAGIAGVHIEDQLFPKRAHYHKYVAHVIPRKDFADKIRLACREREQSDKDFVIIARSDSCRFEGLDEAIARVNMAADAGAGFGEPLHTMRTVREFIHAGIAGVHIEDQLFPKRAHYHKYVAHVVPRKEFVDKIRLACRQRDQGDKDFAIGRCSVCR